MRIIIVGAGEVGFHIAQRLAGEKHDVVVVERDEGKRQQLQDQLDVLTIGGNGASAKVLLQAGVRESDMLIAVTDVDEVNIIACMLAARLGVPRKIARVRNPEYTSSSALLAPEELGIDLLIHPEEETAAEIVRLLKRSVATEVVEFAQGQIQLVGMALDKKAPILGKSLSEVDQAAPGVTFRVVAISRGGGTIIPQGEDRFYEGDQIFVVARPEAIPQIERLIGRTNRKLERVMILGGGKVGFEVARSLQRDRLSIKLIESNREKSIALADRLEKTLVIRGDGTDIDLLAREGILEMDAFVALTGDDEDNIIACLLAKHLGVKKTIALIRRSYYIPLMPRIGIDAAVNPILSTVAAILRFVRRGRVVSVAPLKGVGVEAVEMVASPASQVVGKPLREVHFPKGGILGVIIRGREVLVPTGDDIVQADDKVIVFATPTAIPEMERMFA